MKKTLYLCCLLIAGLLINCSKKDDLARAPATSSFTASALTLPVKAGKAELSVKWLFSEWEITTNSSGFLSDFTFLKGGSQEHTGTTKISFNYAENTLSSTRVQEILLSNKTTGEKSKIVITQNTADPVDIAVALNTGYQTVTGFGGMNNVWAAGLLSLEEVQKMYAQDGLGYNMMRIMISPDKSEWGRDVATTLKAQSLGARILASPWTPPAEMKTSNSRLRGHLLPGKYADYVKHLNDFIAYMKAQGITIEAVSIQNEPDWSPDYDGCEWTPEEILSFIKNHGGSINAKVLAAEAVNFKKMYTDPVLNDAVAVNHIGIVGGHLYGGGLADYPLAREKGKEIWMTEHLLNEVNDGLGWDQALVFAKELNDCMEANFNAYFWWYLKRSYSMLGDGEKGTAMGDILKRGYVMAHYAKYATGRKRIQVGKVADNNQVSITAYSGDKDITLVLVNTGNTAVPSVKINLPVSVKSGESIETLATHNMVKSNMSLSENKQSAIINLPAKSVVSVRLVK